MIGNNLSKFILDIVGVDGLAANGRERLGRILKSTLLHKVARRFGENEKPTTKDDSPNELNADGDTIRRGAVEVLSGIDNAIGQQDTDGNAKLVAGHEGTANFLRCNFLIHGQNQSISCNVSTP